MLDMQPEDPKEKGWKGKGITATVLLA